MFGGDDPWSGDDPWAGVLEQPPMPDVPSWVADEPGPDVEAMTAGIELWLAALPPEERFAAEFGRPATPDELERFAPGSLELAAYLQDIAVQASSVRTHADARRIATLLTAHDRRSSISRIGSDRGSRTGRAWAAPHSRPPWPCSRGRILGT